MISVLTLLVGGLAGQMLAPRVSKDASDQALVKQAREYLQKMRETTDYGYADRAQKLVDQALRRMPENYEALRVQNEIDLFRHAFPKVVARARMLAAADGKDAGNWAMLGDALMEMGEYGAAEDAYQKMVNLQGGLMSYNRIAWFRYVTGDVEGALEMMQRAVRNGRPGTEHTAWVLMELGHLYWRVGKWNEAEQAYRASLGTFGRMHGAWWGLAQVAAARGKLEEAVECAKKAQAMAPLVEYSGLLADLYVAMGRKADAERQLELVDLQTKMEAASGQKGNRAVALIYANHGRRLEEAVAVAEADLAVRKDVFTWDAYGWALLKAGRVDEAEKASREAMKMGTADALIYFHGGKIAEAKGEMERGVELVKKAVGLNARFDVLHAPRLGGETGKSE
ncbi:MAG: tetratricopeptide repeat protein [Bryobacterales bacterium]|nr:tetratricopeptide repeat protein [Bryobacterales bacterium]